MHITSAPLIMQPLPGRKWLIARDFTVETVIAGSTIVVTVPEGFICDLSSIPRFLWWESTPSDFAEAGVVHDWAYNNHHLPRALADYLYGEALAMLGAAHWRCVLRYTALHLFGWVAYREDAPTDRPVLPRTPQP